MAKTQFLNLDLDLESAEDLSTIIEEFGENVVVLSHRSEEGISKASFEIAGTMDTADRLFAEYFRLVSSLSKNARSAWDSCTRRVFDLGFDGGHEPHAIHEVLDVGTIEMLARVGGSIVVTVYATGLDESAT